MSSRGVEGGGISRPDPEAPESSLVDSRATHQASPPHRTHPPFKLAPFASSERPWSRRRCCLRGGRVAGFLLVATETQMKRRGGIGFSLPVTVVVLAIGFIYFSTVFVFIDRWFGLASSPGLMNAAAFTAVALMCVFNYVASVFTDPGRVPPTFVPDVEDAENPIHEIKRKGGDLRYCQKCSLYKPPRAHHCRVCKRCVLRMDHHCIWINNCVGNANYKVFFVFVVYAVTACIYSLVLLLGSLIIEPEKDEQENEDSSRTIYVISALLLVPLCIALSVLLCWHIYLILQNKTTIEYHEGVRAMWLAEKGGSLYNHPYDLGAYENLTTVLGPNILSWVCPTSTHIGSGLRFRTLYDDLAAPAVS